jgi:hypothetical protein
MLAASERFVIRGIMEFTITVAAELSDQTVTEAASLVDWLRADRGLAGSSFRLVQPAVRPGELGAVPDTVAGVLGSGGVVALAGALSVWLRVRTSDLRVRISGTRTVELDVKRLRGLDAERVSALLQEAVAASLEADSPTVPGERGDESAS